MAIIGTNLGANSITRDVQGILCSGTASTVGGGTSCIGAQIDHNAICRDFGMVYDTVQKKCVAPASTSGSGSGSTGSGSTGSGNNTTSGSGSTGGSNTTGGTTTGTGNTTTPASTTVTDQIKAGIIVAVILWVAKQVLKG